MRGALIPWAAVAVLALAVPAPAGTAGPATVAMGADAFATRLTIGRWPVAGWSVQQWEDLVEIRFPGTEMEIASDRLSPGDSDGRLFDIETLVEGGSTLLQLTLGCACAVAVTGDGESEITIEIVGAPVTAMDAAAGPAPHVAPVPVPRHASASPVPPGSAALDPDAARERLLRELERAAAAGMITLVDPNDPLAPPLDPGSGGSGDPVAGAGAGAPSADGIRSDAGAPAPVAAPDPAEPAGAAVAETRVPGPPDGAAGAPDSALDDSSASGPGRGPAGHADAPRATISAPPASEVPDSRVGAAAPAAAVEPPGDAGAGQPAALGCLPDSSLDLMTESRGVPLADAIADLRARLLGEFDRADADVADVLARHYLRAGFGFEARAVLELFGGDSDERAALMEIATIVEGGRPTGSARVLRAPGCSGSHALWQALDRVMHGDPAGALTAEARAGRAIERLPIRLRLIASARLGHAAADLGNWEAARRFQAMGARSDVDADPYYAALLTHLEARLARQRGDVLRYRELIGALALRGDDIGAEAQIELAESMLDAPGTDARPLLIDLGASALVRRGTELGMRALIAEIRLSGAVDGIHAGLDRAADGVAAGVLDEAGYARLARQLAAGSAREDDSTTLASAYMAQPERFAAALAEPGFRRALVRALADAGLPGLAKSLMRDPSADDALDLADSFLGVGEAERALAAAAGFETQRAGALTARAAMLLGRPLQALAAIGPPAGSAPGDAEAEAAMLRARAGWLAGDWNMARDALGVSVAMMPDRGSAVRLALAAWRAGATTMPVLARSALESADPELLVGLELFFAGPADAGDPVVLIDRAGRDAETIRRLLENG